MLVGPFVPSARGQNALALEGAISRETLGFGATSCLMACNVPSYFLTMAPATGLIYKSRQRIREAQILYMAAYGTAKPASHDPNGPHWSPPRAGRGFEGPPRRRASDHDHPPQDVSR